jgi:hypothetical protein
MVCVATSASSCLSSPHRAILLFPFIQIASYTSQSTPPIA